MSSGAGDSAQESFSSRGSSPASSEIEEGDDEVAPQTPAKAIEALEGSEPYIHFLNPSELAAGSDDSVCCVTVIAASPDHRTLPNAAKLLEIFTDNIVDFPVVSHPIIYIYWSREKRTIWQMLVKEQYTPDDDIIYGKLLLSCFLTSHIVLLAEQSGQFDLSFVPLAKVLEARRHRLRDELSGELEALCPTLCRTWITHGRPCSPRLLCSVQRLGTHFGEPADVRQLQHSIEDQIYRVLRKTYVVTNITNKTLFAIPANNEYVHVFSQFDEQRDFFYDPTHALLCDIEGESGYGDTSTGVDLVFSIDKLLGDHIKIALKSGFDDNMGRNPAPSFFSSVKLSEHVTAIRIVVRFCAREDSAFEQGLGAALHPDVLFSRNICSKLAARAHALYEEGLPRYYSEQLHAKRLALALNHFKMQARGAATEQFLAQLETDCEATYSVDRRICGQISLLGNPCTQPLHSTPGEPESELPVLEHCSKAVLLHSCDCGNLQTERPDPFDFAAANVTFYAVTAAACCINYDRVTVTHETSCEWYRDLVSWSLVRLSEFKAIPTALSAAGFADHMNNMNTYMLDDGGFSKKPQKLRSGGSKSRVLLGFEYECPRGHRYLSNWAHKSANLSRLTNGEWPVFQSCVSCESSLAQLKRLYMALPETQQVTLQPTISLLGTEYTYSLTPIILESNSQYVLRFPFCYPDHAADDPPHAFYPEGRDDCMRLKLMPGFLTPLAFPTLGRM